MIMVILQMSRPDLQFDVNTSSVAGDFGVVCQSCAEELLKRDWVTVLATDAHNLAH